mgnify:CR=1 FL=1|jgi:predicted transcriptional regulator|tara:strand:- start:177 stop:509 length:333 start_codon:yes stop_codon:yes gene_type:complete
MVHKNYKWNISEERGRKMAYDLILDVIKEKNNYIIDIEELTFLLNNRTKTVTITNNNKTKNLTNYIKTVFGGLINFIKDYDNLSLQKKNECTFLKLTESEMTDWIFVADE